MKHISDYITESSLSQRDYEQIKFVYFHRSETYGGKEYISGEPFNTLDDLIDEWFDEDLNYDGYYSLDDVIADLKKLKPGDKIVFSGDNDGHDFIDMVARLK